MASVLPMLSRPLHAKIMIALHKKEIELGDRKTNRELCAAAADAVLVDCLPEIRALIIEALLPMGRGVLKRGSRNGATELQLRLPIDELPANVAIPRDNAEGKDKDDAERDPNATWVRFPKAKFRELKRNLAMRDRQIESSQIERDKIGFVVRDAEFRGATDDDTVESVYGAREVDPVA